MEVIDNMIDGALGTMANDMQNAPTRSQLLVNMLRGQPSFADMSANPDMQPASTAPPPQMPPPRPAYNPQNPLAQATAAARAQRPQVQAPPPMQTPQMPPPQPQQPAFDPLVEQGKSLDTREAALTAQMEKLAEPPDRTQSQAIYDKRVQSGDNAMLLALAAQQAGPGFEPFQQFAMKQAAERQAPMKVAGGEFTPQGFIEDSQYVYDKRMAVLNQQLSHIQAARNSNITEQSRQDLKKHEDVIRQEAQRLTLGLQAAIAQGQSADRRFAAELSHQDRQAALQQAGSWSLVGTDPDTGAQVFHNSHTNQRAAFDNQGNAIPYQKTEVVPAGGRATGKGTGDPQITLDLVSQIKPLLKQATSSGFGNVADKAAAFFGSGTEGANANAAIRPYAARLVASMPRMEGPQSDKDVAMYKQAAGNLDDPTVPYEVKMASLQAIESLATKYKSGEFVPPNATRAVVPVVRPVAPGGASGAPTGGGSGVVDYGSLK